MTVLEHIEAAGDIETRQERARRRVARLDGTFQSVFEILAEIYRDEDWRYINDPRDNPYPGFTAFVRDRLGCAASNARRYQQGISTLVLPLQQIAAPGTRIPVTSADVARLGVTGARVVVEEAPAALAGIDDLDDQSNALRDLIDSVTKRGNGIAGFGPIRPSLVESAAPLGALVPAALPPAGGPQEPATAADPEEDAIATDSQPPAPPEFTPPADQTHPAAAEPSAPADAKPASVDHPAPAEAPTDRVDRDTTMDTAMIDELDGAVEALLQSAEPATLADQLLTTACTDRAQRYLAAAQKLARVGQLLRMAN